MLTFEFSHETGDDLSAALSTSQEVAGMVGETLYGSALSYRAHEQAALVSAVDDGLMLDEVAQILAGRKLAEAFPVRWGESPQAYAARAVSEMFVAYLQ